MFICHFLQTSVFIRLRCSPSNPSHYTFFFLYLCILLAYVCLKSLFLLCPLSNSHQDAARLFVIWSCLTMTYYLLIVLMLFHFFNLIKICNAQRSPSMAYVFTHTHTHSPKSLVPSIVRINSHTFIFINSHISFIGLFLYLFLFLSSLLFRLGNLVRSKWSAEQPTHWVIYLLFP